MKKLLLILLLNTFCMWATADNPVATATLTGNIKDASDGSNLMGVTVFVPDLSIGTVTDENGNYSLKDLPKRKLTLQISYVGHQTIIKTLDLTKDTHVDFVMKESNALINEVVVKGVTGSILLKDASAPVAVLTKKQIDGISSTNIIDAIAHQPGISQITTGSGISKPIIRGLGYNRIVTIDDGVRQEGQQWGDEHGIEVDAQRVGSVEVLKGPASLMYGSDAMAGVVILNPRPAAPMGQTLGNITSEYQSNNGLFDYSLNLEGNQNGWIWGTRYSEKFAHPYHNSIDGYVHGSQFHERAFNTVLGANKSWGYSHLNLSYYHLTPSMIEPDNQENGSDKSYKKALPFQQIHHYKAAWNQSIYIGRGQLVTLLAYQQNRREEYEESASTPGLDLKLHTFNYGARYNLGGLKGWKLTAGLNGMYQRSMNKGTEFLIPDYSLFDIGTFITGSYKINRWTTNGGIRFDSRHLHAFALSDLFQRLSRQFNGLSGSFGTVYKINERMNLRMNVSAGFRAPNLSELCANGVHEGTFRYERGNNALKAEKSLQFDLGWDYTSSWLSSQIALFCNTIDNYIFMGRTAEMVDNLPVYMNMQGDARLWGGEFSLDLHPIETLHMQNSFSFVNAVQLHQPDESKYLPMTPAPRWNGEIRYTFIRDGKTLDNLYAKIEMECNFRQNHFYKIDHTETATPSYTLLGASLATDIKHKGKKAFSVYLIGENLLNRAYQNHLSRLKYAGLNPVTGKEGFYNMGRNITLKVDIPLTF